MRLEVWKGVCRGRREGVGCCCSLYLTTYNSVAVIVMMMMVAVVVKSFRCIFSFRSANCSPIADELRAVWKHRYLVLKWGNIYILIQKKEEPKKIGLATLLFCFFNFFFFFIEKYIFEKDLWSKFQENNPFYSCLLFHKVLGLRQV